MTAIHDGPARPRVDGRPHRLLVAVDLYGEITVQAADDVRDVDVALGELVELLRADQHVHLAAPPAGQNVMPCSDCGAMLHSDELQWRPLPAADPGRLRNGVPIRRVVCASCHRAAR